MNTDKPNCPEARHPSYMHPPVFEGALIAWADGVGTVDASSLGLKPGEAPCGRVYNDACDLGCVVRGRAADVLFTYVDSDGLASRGEGLLNWRFKGTVDGDVELTLIVFND